MLSRSIILGAALAVLSPFAAYAAGEKTVTIVTQASLPSVDSCQVQTGGTARVIKFNVVEALTEIDLERGGAKPLLATGWERLNPATWQFKLREGVKFHDGSPMSADAVLYSIKRALNKTLGCDALNRYFTNVEVTAEKVDDYTVNITTNPAQPILPTLMESVPIISMATPMDENTRDPIGTGPFIFTKWDTQVEILLDRNPNYWGQQPVVEQARYLWREDSFVRATMVKLGEADIAVAIADQHADNPETDISFYNSEMLRIQINTDQPPMNDVRVRKALNLALDRQGLIGVLVNKNMTAASQIIGPSTLGYDPDLKPYPYDPEQARQLLAAAKADGAPIERPMVMIAQAGNFPGADEVMEAFVAMWAEVGLKVEVRVLETGQFRASGRPPYDPNRSPTMRFSSHDNATGDAAVSILSKYHSSSYQVDVPSPEMDAMIEAAAAESDPESRRAQFQAILRTLHEDVVPEIWVYQNVATWRIGPRINYTPNAASAAAIKLSTITFK